MRFIQLILVSIFINSIGQNQPRELGIGFVVALNPYQFEDGRHFANFFLDKNLTKKATVAYYKNVQPYMYKPDYGFYHFICISKSENFYEILINNSTKGYIAMGEDFYFISWESLLMNKTVERLTLDNPIFNEPSNKSQVLEYSCSTERLRVDEVIEKDNEYWILVSYLPTCEDINDAKTGWSSGWIKWRSKNELLVNIFLLC